MSTVDIIEHYSSLLRAHGDGPAAVHWADAQTQRRRFAILAEIIADRRQASVLDVGCGLGHLREHLMACGYDGAYSGIDINPEFVARCRAKYPDARFEVWNIDAASPPWTADYVLCSGLFNNAHPAPRALLKNGLRHMFAAAHRGLAFNAMSTYVDFMIPELTYHDPAAVFEFCKEQLSPAVTLRHDYQVKAGVVPFEFAVYVHKVGIPPRPRLPSVETP